MKIKVRSNDIRVFVGIADDENSTITCTILWPNAADEELRLSEWVITTDGWFNHHTNSFVGKNSGFNFILKQVRKKIARKLTKTDENGVHIYRLHASNKPLVDYIRTIKLQHTPKSIVQ